MFIYLFILSRFKHYNDKILSVSRGNGGENVVDFTVQLHYLDDSYLHREYSAYHEKTNNDRLRFNGNAPKRSPL